MKFEYGTMVEYRHTKGWVNFICDDYITICFIDRPDKYTRTGRYQANLLVYRDYWHEIRSCVDEEQEEQTISPRSNLLQIGRRDLVGAAC